MRGREMDLELRQWVEQRFIGTLSPLRMAKITVKTNKWTWPTVND